MKVQRLNESKALIPLGTLPYGVPFVLEGNMDVTSGDVFIKLSWHDNIIANISSGAARAYKAHYLVRPIKGSFVEEV